MTGAIAMGTNKITGLGDPTAAQDAVTKSYAEANFLDLTGGTMTGAIDMGSAKITTTYTPTNAADLTTKTYVDGILTSGEDATAAAAAAATSEANAATSETNAANSATAAASSATSAAASYDDFDDRYLGAKSSAPTVDNDGDALINGALYFNTTTNIMYVYGSSGWQAAGSSVNGTSDRQTYTATAGQTVFAATYDAGYVDVYLNGVKLLAGTDFTATNGTSITLASGAAVNDIVDIVAYGTFVLADHLTETQSDAKYVQQTHTGNVSIDGNLGIGTTSPTHPVTIQATGTSGNSLKIIGDSTNSTGRILWRNTSDTNETGRISVDGSSNMTFLGYNGAERMRIDSSGNVGIGTNSPISYSGQTSLTINGTSVGRLDLQGTGTVFANSNNITLQGAYGKNVVLDGGTTAGIQFQVATSEKARIDSSGNVGIGTTSPVSKLHVSGNITINNSSNAPYIDFVENADTTDSKARIAMDQVDGSNGQLLFSTEGSGTLSERMRIDSSGNLLVGRTSTSDTNVGGMIRPDGFVQSTRDGNIAADFNRNTSDGDIVRFSKGSSPVGTIGSTLSGARLTIDGTDGVNIQTFLVMDDAIYLGGTAAGNALDDYEEGTWTVAFTPSTSGTISLAAGGGAFYTKVGQAVHISISVTNNSSSSPVGYIGFNLPFAAASGSQKGRSALALYFDGVASSNVADFIGLTIDGTSEGRIYLGDNPIAQSDSAQQMDGTCYILISATYITSA